jgi:hypothetical protein
MTVGKPNFNLNSFGIKYLSKDEVQEFLKKKDKENTCPRMEVASTKLI